MPYLLSEAERQEIKGWRRLMWMARRRQQLNRPLDMGGPRDVWLEFYPPPDPRFDNMAPVGIGGMT